MALARADRFRVAQDRGPLEIQALPDFPDGGGAAAGRWQEGVRSSEMTPRCTRPWRLW